MHGRPAPQTLGDPRASHPQRWRVLVVLVLALLVTSIDHTIINVALPRLVDDLGATGAQLQWVVASYTIVFAGLLLTAGSLGDRFGRRRALIAGLATFLAGSVGAALATSTSLLIASRGVMGLGGALIMPTTLSILVNVFGDPRERAKAIAVWTAASGVGIAVGPIVGGALMRSFSWSSVFWINVPLLGAALLVGLHIVPDSRDPAATRLDPVGALLSIASVGTLVYAIIEAPTHGWNSAATATAFSFGIVLGVLFVAWELHRDDPMLDMRLFANRGFSASSIGLALLFFAMAGAVFLQAQYLQFILGYTPLAAGFALVPAAVGMLVGTGAGAHMGVTLGGRRTVTTGLLIATGGIALQAALVDGTSYVPTGIGLLLFGLGAGITMPSATDIIMSTLPPARAGVGSAVNDTVRELGGALGVAVIGSVAATGYTSTLASGITGLGPLPDAARLAALDNVGAALHVSEGLGTQGVELASLARSAFVDSMSTGLWVAAGVALCATVIAWRYLPRDGAPAGHAGGHHHGSRHAHPTTDTPGDTGPGADAIDALGHAGHGRPHRPASSPTPAVVEAATPVTAGHRTADHRARVRRHVVPAGAVVLAAVLVTALASCSTTSDSARAATPADAPTTTVVTPPTTVVRPTDPRDERIAVQGSARLHLRCVGEGDTTAVMIAGVGAVGDPWAAIEPTVTRSTRMCAYDRFGVGGSDPAPAPQTFATEAADLHTLLQAAGEPGPYLVVGHSYGGAEAATFASMFPEDVTGLLLIDASPVTWNDASCAVVDDGSEVARSFRQSCALVADPAANPERLDGPTAFAQLAEIDTLGDLPMTVTTAADHPFPTALDDIWNRGQEQWAALSSASLLVPVADTGHDIQLDQPAIIAEQFERLLARTRSH